MSKLKRLIMLLSITALCSQSVCTQTRMLGIEELFALAEEQSVSIQIYKTETEAAGEALKAAKAQRLPEIGVSLSASYLGNGQIWDRDFSNAMEVEMPHFGNNFALEAQQVIYAGGAISSGIKQAELSKSLAELDLQKNVQEIRFLLVGHYLFILFLLYDAPIRRELKQMPSWQKVRNQVVASLTSKRWK